MLLLETAETAGDGEECPKVEKRRAV